MKRWFIFLTLLLLSSAHAKNLKVLFVGNSYTYVCGMPDILKAMAEAKGHTLQYEQQTPGGRTFQQHWEAKRAVEKMKADSYDVIVFQNQSFEPVANPANMMKYGKLLAAEADKTGARKLYYLTMAYKEPLKWMKEDNAEARHATDLFPEMLERLTESYTRLADETDGEIAPVGIAWNMAYQTNPDLKLHAADHSHPSAQGAYLTALVFYATLFEDPPQNMPEQLTVQARKKGKLQPLEIQLDSKTRKILETAAQKACGKYSGAPPL